MTGILVRIGVAMQKYMQIRRPREARGRHNPATSRGTQGSLQPIEADGQERLFPLEGVWLC